MLAGIAAEMAAADDAADDEQIDELQRAGRASRRLLDRLRSASLARIDLVSSGQGRDSDSRSVAGAVVAVGRDVVVIAAESGDWAVPLWGIAGVVNLVESTHAAESPLDRLGLAAVARSWARDRSIVRVHRGAAPSLDGTIDDVGADFVDLAEHDPGEPRRSESVRRLVTVPFGSMTAIMRRPI